MASSRSQPADARRPILGGAGGGALAAVISFLGLAVAALALPQLAPAPAAAAGSTSDATYSVTCTGLGTITVSPATGTTTPALPAGVQLHVGYHATDDRTGVAVTGGAAAGSLPCGTIAFRSLPPGEVAPVATAAGAVDRGDRLSGVWTVSVTISQTASGQPAARPAARPAVAIATAQAFPASIVGGLQSYLSSRAGSVSVAVFDAGSGATYALTSSSTFVTASIEKVDILATLLRKAQVAQRSLTSSEQSNATNMIEFSDNTAATSLWNEVGGGPGVAAFNNLIGMPNTVPGPGGLWGLTTTTAVDQVSLMRTVAYSNSILGDPQRAYILGLMEHVTSSQAWGVSGGVPAGTTIALKNGWLPVTNGWEINSIGHIQGGGRDYVIAVLTTGSPTMPYGINTVQGVSSVIWTGLASSTSKVAVGRNQSGTLQLFAVSSGRVVTAVQSGPGKAFGAWQDMAFPLAAVGVPGVGVNASGALQVFVRTVDGILLTSWESGPNQGFGGWADLGVDGQIASDPTLGLNSNGTMQVFVGGTGGRVLSTWQTGPNQGFGGWLDMGFTARAGGVPGIGVNDSGALQMFVRTTDNRLLTSWQNGPSSAWGGWADLGIGGQIGSDPTLGSNSNGSMQVFVRGTGGRVLTSWQTGPNQGFGGWLDMQVSGPAAGQLAVGVNASGALQIFEHTADNRVVTSWQNGPSSAWGGWADLGSDGQLTSDPTVGQSSIGTIQLYVRGLSSTLLATGQAGPDQGFVSWVNIGFAT